MDGDFPRRLISGGGGGGGGKGGGGSSRTPIEEPNTLKSKATARVVDLLGEGEIYGLKDGLKSVYYDETPLQSSDGTYNFPDVLVSTRSGTPTQTYVEGFPTEVTLALGTGTNEFTSAQSWERLINDTTLDALRVVIRIPALTFQDTSTGDLKGSSVDVKIDIRQSTGTYTNVVDQTITGKCVSVYERGYRIDLPKPGPWYLRVRRTTEASTSSHQRSTYVASIIGLTDAKYSYPNSALVLHRVDAGVFGGAIPKRAYRVLGLLVAVPDIYDSMTRLYSSSVWTGVWKSARAWTNNPAWVYYDLLTNKRYGLGEYVSTSQVDIYELFEIAKYCDGYNARPWNTEDNYGPNGKHGVPNGQGGFEPRFTFNGLINTRREAYQVLQSLASTFRGMTYWGTGTVVPVQDRPGDVIHTVTQANVKDGTFNYQSSALKDRATICQVTFNDPNDFFRPAVETVEHQQALLVYGPRIREITAFGCTSRTEAHRLGKWSLDTDWSETDMVNYATSLDHILARPGQLAAIADPVTTGDRMGGRLAEYDALCIAPQNQNLILEPVFERRSLDTQLSNGTILASNIGSWQSSWKTPAIVDVADQRWRCAIAMYDRTAILGQIDLDTGRRTNLFINPRLEGTGTAVTGGNLPVGIAVTAAGGLAWSLVARTTVNGMPVLRMRLSGTATGVESTIQFNVGTDGTVATGDRLCASAYIQRSAGTRNGLSERIVILYLTSAGAIVNGVDTGATVGTNPLDTQRYLTTGVAGTNAVNAMAYFSILATVGQAIDITYDFSYPQVEWGVSTPGTMILPPVGTQRIMSVAGTASGFEVVPGEVLYGSAWMETLNSGGLPGYWMLAYYSHRNAILANVPVATATAGQDWAFYSGSSTVPAFAVRAVPFLYRDIVGGSGTVGGDNIKATSLYFGRAAAYTNNGADRVLKLDSTVTLGGNDEVMIPKKAGGLMTAPITYAAGPQRYIYLSSGLSERPMTGFNFIVSSGNARPKKFRIYQVRETSMTEFEVTATEHDETKYLRVEFDYQLPIPVTSRLSTGPINPPSNFQWRESLFRRNNAVSTRLTMSWEPTRDANGVQDSRVNSYAVDMFKPSGVWERITITTQTGIELEDVQPGAYQVRVTARTLLGSSLPLESGSFTVLGKSAPPGNVTNFTLTARLSGVLLTWTEVTDVDLVGYEIRTGASWETGTVVSAALKGTSFFVALNDTISRTYFIRAKDDTGNYSTSSAQVTGTVSTPGSVTEMNAVPQNEGVTLSWTAVDGVDIEYEVRVGSVWDFAQTIARVTATSYYSTYPGAGIVTFWVKAVSKLGLYSSTPTFAQCVLNNPAFRNVVISNDYKNGTAANGISANFATGQKINMAYESATASLVAQTNMLVDNSQYGTSNWSRSGITVTANAAAGPDGSVIADRINEGTSTFTGLSQTCNYQAGVTYRFAVQAKPTTGSKRYVSLLTSTAAFGAFRGAVFDVTNGTITYQTSNVTPTITALANGYYECALQSTATASAVTGGISMRFPSSSTDIFANFTGDGVSGMLLAESFLTVVGFSTYGEYFIDVALADQFLARNWLESDFGLVDANTLTWAQANFAWNSEQASKVSWISTGESTGALAERTISLKRTDALPSSLTFGAELNSSLTDVRSATVTSSAGVNYAAHVVRQGVQLTPGSSNTVVWNYAAPSTFSMRITARTQVPTDTSETLANLYYHDGASVTRQAAILRYASGVIQGYFLDGGHVNISDLTVLPEDIITVALVQTASARILAVYSHRQRTYKVATRTTAPCTPTGAFNNTAIGPVTSSATTFAPVLGNFEVYSALYENTALQTFVKTGLAPVGYLPFQALLPGDYDYRYAILGVQLVAPSGVGRPALTAYKHVVDVVDVTEQRNVTTNADWTAFTFTKKFATAPAVAFFQRGGAATIAIGETRNVTKTGFEGRLVNTSGSAVAGSATFIAAGY